MENKNKPTMQKRAGLVSASVFEREQKTIAGDSFTSQTIALQISYKKGEEFINNNITIIKQNLPHVIDVLTQISKDLKEVSK